MKITVLGTGYLGAVHAAGMAELGHDVLGYDVDQRKIANLADAVAPFYEPDFPELLRKHIGAGRLRFTTSIDDVADFGDVHFVCVGTPQLAGSDAADLRYVDEVVEQLGARLTRDCLIVGKSTVPVGTAMRLAQLLETLTPDDVRARLAWNPEFLREGFAVEDTLRPDRLVFGVRDNSSRDTLSEVYRQVLLAGVNCVVTDLATAELVKVAANSFLATKISFINAMSEVCETTGADVVTLADAIGYDARIGRRFLNAGVGFGGGCLGKDIRAFRARGEELGVGEALSFLRPVDEVNNRRRRKVVELANTVVGGELGGRRVGVLGAAFKPNSDDVRDSPALHVARELATRGAVVRLHDPAAIENARAVAPELEYADSVEKVFEAAEVVIHLTEWTEYRELDPAVLVGRVNQAVLIDARNALDAARWQAAGWTVHALGRSLDTARPVGDAITRPATDPDQYTQPLDHTEGLVS